MNQLAHLRAKARALFSLEERLSQKDKATQQWQLLTQVGGVNIIVGKGGINTAFYVVHDRERRVCFPDELLVYLSDLASRRYVFYALMPNPKTILALKDTEVEALKITPKPGAYIVGLTSDGKRRPLFECSTSLVGPSWRPARVK